uniref:Contactin 1 n=1 Tax=Latimeria chalumnae TaxID=7897 RepID=H3A356_LATCH
EEGRRYGPVFEEQPIDTIYPEESPEGRVSMNCRARGNPSVVYKWKLNSWDINLDNDHYSMVGGNLMITNPEKHKDAGKYICIATNEYGTIVSKEATLSFGYLDPFSTDERFAVEIKEGIGAVLLCEAPYHYPDDLTYRWLYNEFPTFIHPDRRRFVSQTTGNLYIAKVESTDIGNYSCFVSSPSVTKSVFSKSISFIPQPEGSVKRYPADIKVRFKDTYATVGQNVTLECFALGNPVPEISWQKVSEQLPSSAEVSTSGAILNIFNIQPEDEGTYECKAENSKGRDTHRSRVYVQAYPEWIKQINDTQRDIGSTLTWPCEAKGNPVPSIRWQKNGQAKKKKKKRLGPEFRRGELKINSLSLEDAGMYQCIAENSLGSIYANAELKVLALAPTFESSPVKKKLLAAKGGRLIVHCKPKAAPKPRFFWSKGTEMLTNSSRMSVWRDGTLEILNVTKMDEGSYTCVAENKRGKANSTGTLSITAVDATKITLAPSNADVTVGENATMQCHASHDSTLDLTFIWSVNGYVINYDKEKDHYERNLMSEAGSELIIKDVHLRHAGRYTCTAQTIVDNATASADLVVRGPPGPPGGVRVEDIKDTSVTLTWSRGTDNHSPISKYIIQAKNILSEDWKDVKT